MRIRTLLCACAALLALASCQQEVEHYMTLSTKELTAEADGGTLTFDVTSNVYYRVNNDCDFAKISEMKTVGDVTTFTLSVDKNTSKDARKSQIRLIGDYVTPLKLIVNQDAPEFNGVDPSSIEASFNATSASFNVITGRSWSVKSDNAEFVPSPEMGAGNGTVVVKFPANMESAPKSATITVTIAGVDYPVAITQGVMPVVDLSEAGTSNCYIIRESGKYKFKANVRGNGAAPASNPEAVATAIAPASIKVLWATENTAVAPSNDDFISDLKLEGEYVSFSACLSGYKPGNVVIAALDASGNIIWNWHLWFTPSVAEITCGTVKWLDRNLGALAPSTQGTTDPLAIGLHFQWGRKDPFRGSFTLNGDDADDIATTATWPEAQLVTEDNGSIAFAIANPMTAIYVADAKHNNKDWIWNVQYDDLWGAGAADITKTTKTMYDPCPLGYCVPTSQQHKDLASEFGLSKSNIATYGIGNSNFWFVYAGGLLYNTGTIGGPVGGYSWYASSSVSGINMLCTRSHTTAGNFGGATSARSAGYSIRCVKE